jgi:2-methylcitrate dehydratase PrpD
LISRSLAEFIRELSPEHITPLIHSDHLMHLFVDTLACAVAGTVGPSATSVIGVYGDTGDVEHASIVCREKKTAVHTAALVNTFLARNYTFDDIFEGGVVHSGAAIIMSALAVGEWLNSQVSDFLAGVIGGYEIASRIAKAMNPSHYSKGFHPTGTCNTVGVAAAISKLLELDAKGIESAMNLSADGACGFRQYQVDGNIVNSAFHAAKAAETGIMAALLAKNGFPGPGDAIAGEFGLLHCMSDKFDEKTLIGGLGSDFLFMNSSLKPYPSCRYMHGAVDATAKCKRENGISVLDIEKINISTFHMAFVEGNRPKPSNTLDAQFSIHYNTAVYLRQDRITVNDFSDQAIARDEVLSLCDKINVHEEAALSQKYPEQWPFRAEIILRNGKRYSSESFYPPGSALNPLSEQELLKKWESLVEDVIGKKRGHNLLEVLTALFSFQTVGEFVKEVRKILLP